MSDTAILLAGSGGQGVQLASRLLTEYFFLKGDDVKSATIIGLGIKGGGILCHVRSGTVVHSALAVEGAVDLVLGFEEIETLRILHYLKPGGLLVMHPLRIQPTTVGAGLESPWTASLDEILAGRELKHHSVPAPAPDSNGHAPALNTYLLGRCAGICGMDRQGWLQAFRNVIPQKSLEANLHSFECGWKGAHHA